MKVQVIRLSEPETFIALGTHEPMAVFRPASAGEGSTLVLTSTAAKVDQVRLTVFRSWVRRVCIKRHQTQPIEEFCGPEELQRSVGITSRWVYDTSTPLESGPDGDDRIASWKGLIVALRKVSQAAPLHSAQNRFAEFGEPSHPWLRVNMLPGGPHLAFATRLSERSKALLELCGLSNTPDLDPRSTNLTPHTGYIKYVSVADNDHKLHIYLPRRYEITVAFMEFLESSFSDRLAETKSASSSGDFTADSVEPGSEHQPEDSNTCH